MVICRPLQFGGPGKRKPFRALIHLVEKTRQTGQKSALCATVARKSRSVRGKNRIKETVRAQTVLAGLSSRDYASSVYSCHFVWGVTMKIVTFAALASVAGLIGFATAAESKTCQSNYYNGEGHSKSYDQGLANAHGNWSSKVRARLGKQWSKWGRARVRDESCAGRGWPHIEWCNVEAYPCKK